MPQEEATGGCSRAGETSGGAGGRGSGGARNGLEPQGGEEAEWAGSTDAEEPGGLAGQSSGMGGASERINARAEVRRGSGGQLSLDGITGLVHGQSTQCVSFEISRLSFVSCSCGDAVRAPCFGLLQGVWAASSPVYGACFTVILLIQTFMFIHRPSSVCTAGRYLDL